MSLPRTPTRLGLTEEEVAAVVSARTKAAAEFQEKQKATFELDRPTNEVSQNFAHGRHSATTLHVENLKNEAVAGVRRSGSAAHLASDNAHYGNSDGQHTADTSGTTEEGAFSTPIPIRLIGDPALWRTLG